VAEKPWFDREFSQRETDEGAFDLNSIHLYLSFVLNRNRIIPGFLRKH
jgi:hypothetical protein